MGTEDHGFYLPPMDSNVLVPGGLRRHVEREISSTFNTIILDAIEPGGIAPRIGGESFMRIIDNRMAMHPYGYHAGTMLEMETSPLAALIADFIGVSDVLSDSSDKDPQPLEHFVRGVTVNDILLNAWRNHYTGEDDPSVLQSTQFMQRSSLVLGNIHQFHRHEAYRPNTLHDQVKRHLMTGPDIDLVIGTDQQTVLEHILSNAESYYRRHYQTHMPYDGRFLNPVLATSTDTEETYVFCVLPSLVPLRARRQIQVGVYGMDVAPHKTFFIVKSGRRRSGIPYVDLSIAIKADGSRHVDEHMRDDFDSLVTVSITPTANMTQDQKDNDTRLGDMANSWDRIGHAQLELLGSHREQVVSNSDDSRVSASGALRVVPTDTGIDALVRPLELGVRMADRSPVSFVDEALRIVRKVVANEFNLHYSPEGKKHLRESKKTRGYSIALSGGAFDALSRTLHDPDFRTRFAQEWKALPPQQRHHLTSKFTSELITSFIYQPRKTLQIIDDLGLRAYFPNLSHVSRKNWRRIITRLPQQRDYEYSYMMTLATNHYATKRAAKRMLENAGVEASPEKIQSAQRTLETALHVEYHHPILYQLEHVLLQFKWGVFQPRTYNKALRALAQWTGAAKEYVTTRNYTGLTTAIDFFTFDPADL